jgi:hypothetical protein
MLASVLKNERFTGSFTDTCPLKPLLHTQLEMEPVVGIGQQRVKNADYDFHPSQFRRNDASVHFQNPNGQKRIGLLTVLLTVGTRRRMLMAAILGTVGACLFGVPKKAGENEKPGLLIATNRVSRRPNSPAGLNSKTLDKTIATAKMASCRRT